jgi:hypothetical protein
VAFAPPVLRRLALAVAVLYDVDLVPTEEGLVLTELPEIQVGWDALSAIVESAPQAQERSQIDTLAAWLTARRAFADDAAAGSAQLVALGIPADHDCHPGPEWVRESVPGDALNLGFGYGPEHQPVPVGVLEHARIDIRREWEQARAELERLGTLAAERERRQTRRAIKPFGGADVVTLLGSASLRRELVAAESDGMIGLIVPLRNRGWRATYVSDPAYGPALAAAMPELERGFDRPLLVTAEEISEVRAGGDPMRLLRADD